MSRALVVAARAIGAVLLAGVGCARAEPAAAPAAPGSRWAVSAGLGIVMPEGEAAGDGSGFYLDGEYLLRRTWWLTPRLYAGTVLASPSEGCGENVRPCDVSARYGFAGAKVRLTFPVPWVAPFLEAGFGGSAGRFSTRSGTAVDVAESGLTYHVPWAIGLALGARQRWQLRFSYLAHPEMKQTSGGVVFGLEFSPADWQRREAAPVSPPAPSSLAVAPAPTPAPGVTEPSPAGEPPAARRPRGWWYLSGAAGAGAGEFHLREASGEPLMFPWSLVSPYLGVGLGVPIAGRVLVGAEWNVNLGVNCYFASLSTAEGPCDRTVALQHVLGVVTVYPLWSGPADLAPAGWLIRAGGGLALLDSQFAPPEEFGKPPPPPTGERDWIRRGPSALLGAGYAFRTGSRRPLTVDLGLDLRLDRYGRSAWQPDRSWSTVFHAGFTLH